MALISSLPWYKYCDAAPSCRLKKWYHSIYMQFAHVAIFLNSVGNTRALLPTTCPVSEANFIFTFILYIVNFGNMQSFFYLHNFHCRTHCFLPIHFFMLPLFVCPSWSKYFNSIFAFHSILIFILNRNVFLPANNYWSYLVYRKKFDLFKQKVCKRKEDFSCQQLPLAYIEK